MTNAESLNMMANGIINPFDILNANVSKDFSSCRLKRLLLLQPMFIIAMGS